jgi:hypothetical protein
MNQNRRETYAIQVIYDTTELSDEENRQAEEMLKSLWLGYCRLPVAEDNPYKATDLREDRLGQDQQG